MTDKEKAIKLLLDNGFAKLDFGFYAKENYTIRVHDSVMYAESRLEEPDSISSYRELVGFLYLKYGKVYITK